MQFCYSKFFALGFTWDFNDILCALGKLGDCPPSLARILAFKSLLDD